MELVEFQEQVEYRVLVVFLEDRELVVFQE